MSDTESESTTSTRDLKIPVPGTKIVLRVKLEKLAEGSAGSNGIKYKTICRTHRVELKKPYVCPQDPNEVITSDKQMKRYKGGKITLDLEPSIIEQRKVKGDGKFQVLGILNMQRNGIGDTGPSLTALSPGAYALYPVDVEPETLNRYAAFHAYLCDPEGRPARVAQVRLLNRRTIHGIIRPITGGYLVFEEKFRPLDCKGFTEGFTWPVFPPAVRARISQEGAKAEQELDFETLNEDEYRKAMMEAFVLLAEGKPLPEPEAEPVETPEAILDLFASG